MPDHKPFRDFFDEDCLVSSFPSTKEEEDEWVTWAQAQESGETPQKDLFDPDPFWDDDEDLTVNKITLSREGDCLVGDCPTCGRHAVARPVHLDADLITLLDYFMDASDGGRVSVGVTRRTNTHVPDWVVSGRQYGRLRYWGLLSGGHGTYTLTQRGLMYLSGRLSLPETVWVLDDEVIQKSGYRIDVHGARSRIKQTH